MFRNYRATIICPYYLSPGHMRITKAAKKEMPKAKLIPQIGCYKLASLLPWNRLKYGNLVPKPTKNCDVEKRWEKHLYNRRTSSSQNVTLQCLNLFRQFGAIIPSSFKHLLHFAQVKPVRKFDTHAQTSQVPRPRQKSQTIFGTFHVV